ncbi:sensor histidine kinase [Afifella marina]|uniref:histidine kinase n=1 Tax=Afifella marina DSM 2698 TaxID=1120955 RepID=A0A1G5MW29_AFIMA|nr:ATP-binding protein [Afifella marina]MBK1622084.1 hypothetical protein [Afifella marina DSM 2698]MBK1627877.1 hypothetical protein [Afifella marina]MBK5918058.1 hypothetical protein [Afifella marina]RAI19835.1 hypothetical protein CH311_10995 [Afifella marina DSM 2698]SCZ29326.1 Signal transduction histidine kinase regulating C4-dicarboxylate transport system [Afifella marina DSM 2698]
MLSKKAKIAPKLLLGALVVTTLGLFIATGMLYLRQSEQRQLLTTSIRSSGWVAYQAQLEYVKTTATLDIARDDPSPRIIDQLKLRLELLASRLPLLYASEEGRLIAGIDAFAPALKDYRARIDTYLQRLEDPLPPPPKSGRLITQWRSELVPLGRHLQTILEAAVVDNAEINRREAVLSKESAALPLTLMFISGSGLVLLLVVQARRDRRRLHDVLEARRAQIEVETSFEKTMQAMPFVALIFDPDTNEVKFANDEALELVGAPLAHPDWTRLIRSAIDVSKATGQGDARTTILSFGRRDGEISSLRGTISPARWRGRRLRMLALADVTKLRDAELKVMQAAKLATLGEMATAIAHETNQPLAVIRLAIANARRLLENGETGEALAAKLTRISDQVERVKRITDQVRRYGRLTSQQCEPFALQDAVQLAIGFVAEQYRAAGIRLDIDLDFPTDLAVAGEQTMFEQVIVNILVNARDALDALHDRDVDQTPVLQVRGRVQAGSVVLELEDNAGGIAEDIITHLFDPFVTTKPVGKGTGLGLSMARNIVRDMNGDIAARNIRAGACFTIRLPIASAALSLEEAA